MFRALLNDKIGSIIRHFAVAIDPLSLTKLLKLLYLTDETAVLETGSPVTWLEYQVWKHGPVSSDIYQEIKHGEKSIIGQRIISLDNFISIKRQISSKRDGQEEVFLTPKGQDDLSTLSEYEVDLLERIIAKFGNMNAAELVQFLHQDGSLWHKAVEANKLQTNFDLFQNTSNTTIDFSDLIEDDEVLKLAAQSAYEALSFHRNLLDRKLSINA
jgi:uncharacterized phage-associated protein